MEHAHAGPQSFISQSVLGPDVHVSAGEIHASVIGPNTNAHHQSLLISVLWPLGRGNLGRGASVGSNHTGRLPDQETVAGEGIFWGLSTVIKFPVDLSGAPYSVVAAGTQLSPQRIRMPFSLIVTDEAIGGNSIIPGWIVTSSPYTLARSEAKFATRRKAVHHDHYTGWKIIRREIIEQCLWARQSLRNVKAQKPMYNGDGDIAGIGANHLSDKGRLAGIKAYDECIWRFSLGGLLEFVERAIGIENGATEEACAEEFGRTSQLVIPDDGTVKWNTFPWHVDGSDLWNFQKALLLHEFPNADPWLSWVAQLLTLYARIETSYTERIFQCKNRDDKRGMETIPGYASSHIAAADDEVIKDARLAANTVEQKVARLLDHLIVVPGSRL